MATMSVPAIELELSIGGTAICPPGSGVAPRMLDDYEFVWIVDGNATWICGGRTQPAPADTVILVQPGMQDSFRWDPARTARVVYLHFTIRRGLESLPPREQWPALVRLGTDDVLQPLFRQIVKASEQQPEGWESTAHSAAVHLLRSFVTQSHDTSRDQDLEFPGAVERALVHVRNHWETQQAYAGVPLNDLCSAAAVSPRQLSRLFQQTFGVGPVEALRLARLEIAADLLRHTDMTLALIAEMTGFANAFHLSRAFKAVYKVPPKGFRAQPAGPSGPSAQARRLLGKLIPRSIS